MRNAWMLLIGAAALATVDGASMAHGNTQNVRITSEPPGAAIYRGTQLLGTTPAEVEFQRRDATIVLHLEKDGYRTEAVSVERRLSAWVWANFLIGGAETAGEVFVGALVGLSIDFASGGADALRHPATAILTPLSQPN